MERRARHGHLGSGGSEFGGSPLGGGLGGQRMSDFRGPNPYNRMGAPQGGPLMPAPRSTPSTMGPTPTPRTGINAGRYWTQVPNTGPKRGTKVPGLSAALREIGDSVAAELNQMWEVFQEGEMSEYSQWYRNQDVAPTIPGFTLECTTQPVNCNTTNWRHDGYHWEVGYWLFGCNNLAYACNNWGPPGTLEDLKLAPRTEVAVSMDQGPFTQWLRWIYSAPGPTQVTGVIPAWNQIPEYLRSPVIRQTSMTFPKTYAPPLPLKGTSGGAGSSGEWGDPETVTDVEYSPHPDWDWDDRSWTDPRERRTVDITVTNPVIPPDRPRVVITQGRHRDEPDNTKKIEIPAWLFRALRLYHGATEINDFFEALSDSIPGDPCGKLPGVQRSLCVLKNWNKIDPALAVKNLIANEIEDQIVGRVVNTLGTVTGGRYHGPTTTQMTQYLKWRHMHGM